MADDLDNVFPDEPVETPEVIEEPQVVVDEPAEVVPEPEPQPAAPQPEPHRPEPGFVPIQALLEEREKRRAAEEASQRYQAQQQQFQRPDPLDDPDGYEAFQVNYLNQQLAAQKFEMSDMMARQAHGTEVVDTAIQWAQQKAQGDPVFAASYMRERHPIDWIVQQHKQAGLIEQIGNRSMDDFVREYLTKNPQIVAQPQPVQQQAAAPVKVPRSLANQGAGPSDVRDIATGPLAGVDAVFTN